MTLLGCYSLHVSSSLHLYSDLVNTYWSATTHGCRQPLYWTSRQIEEEDFNLGDFVTLECPHPTAEEDFPSRLQPERTHNNSTPASRRRICHASMRHTRLQTSSKSEIDTTKSQGCPPDADKSHPHPTAQQDFPAQRREDGTEHRKCLPMDVNKYPKHRPRRRPFSVRECDTRGGSAEKLPKEADFPWQKSIRVSHVAFGLTAAMKYQWWSP